MKGPECVDEVISSMGADPNRWNIRHIKNGTPWRVNRGLIAFGVTLHLGAKASISWTMQSDAGKTKIQTI